MKKLICGNGNTYEVHDETVCCPSGSANVRNYFEIYMPEKTMTFNQFEALCKNEEAMDTLRLQDMEGDEILALSHYTVPAEIAKKRVALYNNQTGRPAEEVRLYARMEQLTYTEQKLAELGLM